MDIFEVHAAVMKNYRSFIESFINKNGIEKMFEKLKHEVRSTKNRHGWSVSEGRKILRVHYSHGKGSIPGRVPDKIRSQLKGPSKITVRKD